MSDTIKSVLNNLNEVFAMTDEVIEGWTGEGNLQFPVLLGMMALKLNWDEKQVREADPLIRYYIRNNPNWYVTRGAHGGIMRASEKQKKEAAKASKDLAKAQMKAALEAKLLAEATAKSAALSASDKLSDSQSDSESDIQSDEKVTQIS